MSGRRNYESEQRQRERRHQQQQQQQQQQAHQSSQFYSPSMHPPDPQQQRQYGTNPLPRLQPRLDPQQQQQQQQQQPQYNLSSYHPQPPQIPPQLPGYRQVVGQQQDEPMPDVVPTPRIEQVRFQGQRTPGQQQYPGQSASYSDPPSRLPPGSGRTFPPPSPLPPLGHEQPQGSLPRPHLAETQSHDKVAGSPHYPSPAPHREQKARFTPDDDRLLKKLKEEYNSPKLSWKQIADFFPGRKSGTLQVRYCTKIKAKDPIAWTDDADRKLQRAVQEVEQDKWRQVSAKLATGASPKACQDRIEELEAIEKEKREEEGFESPP